MDLRSIALIPVLSFALFQDPDTHSPTAKSTCTPGALNCRETRYERTPIRWSTSPITYRAVAIRHGGSNGSNEKPRRIPQVLLSGLARKV